MARASEILAVAQAELGYTESPAGSNRTKYGAWYGLNGQPWCMMFIQWVFSQAGASDLLPAKTASCGALMRAAKAAGTWVTGGYQPGDVVIYDFPGGAATDHCGLVLQSAGGGVYAIEGNTGDGNDANGGQVQKRIRSNTLIVGAHRPRYQVETEEDDMDIESLTKEQLIRLAERMQNALAERPISDTLAAELEEAKAMGITSGSSPNAFCTRAQAAVMVARSLGKQYQNANKNANT